MFPFSDLLLKVIERETKNNGRTVKSIRQSYKITCVKRKERNYLIKKK